MAKTRNPQMSWNAAASTGDIVNWFQDVDGPRARKKPRNSGKASSRQQALRVTNQIVWDRFPNLPAETREAWRIYARQAPSRKSGKYYIHPAQFIYTGTNIIPYDHRGVIYDDPPWSDPLISPLSMEVSRQPGTGLIVVSASWPSGVPVNTLLDTWECHRWQPPAPRAIRGRWRHVEYMEAPSTSAVLALDPDPHYLIGIRVVSPHGRTWRTWRTWRTEP